MHFIDRNSRRAPEILFGSRTEKARRDAAGFIEQTLAKGGSRRAPRTDWFDEDVDTCAAMQDAFDDLCAYCEVSTRGPASVLRKQMGSDEDPTLTGRIARHRPASLAQDESGHTDLLAYAWLLYDWDNLLWVCDACARFKGNNFFVEAPRGTPSLSVDELRASEQELMLDPCFHDPTQHLTFQVDGSVHWSGAAGRATCEVLALNRTELVARRRDAVLAMAEALNTPRNLAASGGCIVTLTPHGSDPSLAAHTGAVTQAILGFAQLRGLQSDGVDDFLARLAELDEDSRFAFLADLSQVASASRKRSMPEPDIPITRPTSKRAASARSRIPDLDNLPNGMRPVTHVEITNFKALRYITFNLPAMVDDPDQSPCMLILGENSTGKSSVMEAMALAVIGAAEAEALDTMIDGEELSPADLIHRPDPFQWAQTASEMQVRLDFLDSEAPIALIARAGDRRFTGAEGCAKVVLGYGPRRFFTTRRTRRLRAPAHRVRSLFDPMAMIANPIHWLKELDEKAFFAAARALREVLMLDDADDFEREDDPDTPGQVFVRKKESRIALKDLSVGYKSVTAMVCDIIRELLYHFDNLEYAHAVVFIDEIETHLHPRWKMQIMSLLRRALPKVQFIVTTHDPLCLQGMYDGEVFVLQRSPEDQIERVVDLPSIRGMRAEQILTSEFFGLGSTDPETDARLARYNRLATRIEDLTVDERAELERLRAKLDDGMVLGSTLREQAYAEALKKHVAERNVAPSEAASPRRADLRQSFSALFESRPK